jgi:hypothetical protein
MRGLGSHGHDAQTVYLSQASERLRSIRFDLVITSRRLAEEHAELYAAIPVGTQGLLLDGVTFPVPLLAAVSEKLQPVGSATGVSA